jgi:hypothetical protein
MLTSGQSGRAYRTTASQCPVTRPGVGRAEKSLAGGFAGIDLSGLTAFLARTVFGGAVPGLMSLRWSWSY